jgi:3-keto-5-aminohexanoate cleavage enzyme
MMSTRKVILTVAPTGGFLTKKDTPFVPTQPEEIAADVYRCFNAGASIAALHARRADDEATCNPAIYRQINELVRDRCDIVVANSTGGGLNGDLVAEGTSGRWESLAAERAHAIDGGAEICSLNAMSVLGRLGDRHVLMSTSTDQARDLALAMRERGAKPEWEAFSPTHLLQDITQLIGEGVDTGIPWVSLCFGLHTIFQGAVPFSTRTMQYMIDQLPAGCEFNVTGQGRDQVPAVTMGLISGGHVRVGIEDSRWDARAELRSNVWFVEWAARLIQDLGFDLATPRETRALLGLEVERVG